MAAKILLIGAGRWGANHLRTWLALGVDLWVADASDKTLARCAEAGVPKDRLGRSPRDFLKLVDAVDVVTPAETHHPLCAEAIAAGKDVFVEKPITLAEGDGADLVRRAAAAGRILQVGHIFRYEPATVALRKVIASGRLGEVRWLKGNFSGFKRPRMDSGVMMADGIHFVDLFNHLLGRSPAAARARLLDLLGRGMDDNAWAWLDYEGAFAEIECGYFSPLKAREVLVVGTRGSALVDYGAKQDKLKVFANRHAKEGNAWTAIEEGVEAVPVEAAEPLKLELKAFLDSMASRAKPLADGACGVEAVRVTEAVLKAARDGSTVAISNVQLPVAN
jgi:UDP-2-acetamido-3-amino-2,3-dideoxy-glucuronate N-acetyltransferase